MNKKVLGIAAAAAAAGGAVYAASKVKKQAQAQGMRREKESLQPRNYGDKQVYLVGGCKHSCRMRNPEREVGKSCFFLQIAS